MRRPTVLVTVATSLATVAASVAFACSASSASASPARMRGETISEPMSAMIDDLSVSDATHAGDDRDLFKTWIDAGGDGCDTREAYANDLGDPRLLDAVTDNVNQSKGDRDPAHWMPPAPSATCRYLEDWTAMKTRWSLTVDSAELSALQDYASGCSDVTITVTTGGW